MMRILVRAPNWIGDQIMAYPFFYYLRKRYPQAWIATVCTEWVRDIQFKGLVDEVFVIPKNKNDSFFTSIKKISALSQRVKEKGAWDLGISIPNSFGSALLLYWAGAKIRRGYHTDMRGFLLNQKIKWNPSPDIHRAEAYAALLEVEALPDFQMRDFWKSSGEVQFDPITHWPDIVPLDSPSEDYVVIAPGAVADSRRWPTEKYAELIKLIYQKYQLRSVIVGGNAEKEIAAQFLKENLPIIDLTAKGWVSSLWKIFRHARFTVCNESGLAHVAAFCGSPIRIVCGAADPKRTQPIGPGWVHVIVNTVECWPCERNSCQFTDSRKNQCLNGIFAKNVVEGL